MPPWEPGIVVLLDVRETDHGCHLQLKASPFTCSLPFCSYPWMTPWGVAGEFGGINRIQADSTSLAFITFKSCLVHFGRTCDSCRHFPRSLLPSEVLFLLTNQRSSSNCSDFFSSPPRYFHALFLLLTYSHALTLMVFYCLPVFTFTEKEEGSAQVLPGQLERLHPGGWPHLTQFDSHRRQAQQPSHASRGDLFLSMVTLASSARKFISYVFDLANMDMNIHKKLSSCNIMPMKYIFDFLKSFTGFWPTALACIHVVYECVHTT